jgi:hypothetical protein
MSGLDLYQTQRALSMMLVYAAAAGFGLGGVYDVLRFLRVLYGDGTHIDRKGRKPRLFSLLLFLEDVIFSVMAALTLILLVYYTNDGQLRAPAVMGMAGGFFVYMQTVGRLTAKAEKVLSRLVKRAVKLALLLLLRPLLWVGTLPAKAARCLWMVSGGRALAARREKQTEKAVEAIKASAKQGFGLLEGQDPTQKKK